MFAWEWLCSSRSASDSRGFEEPRPFSLPAPIPNWPEGGGFATGAICIGELEVVKVTKFQSIWSYSSEDAGATFYKPTGFPNGFHTLGHYAQPNHQSLHGYVLVAREVSKPQSCWEVTKPRDPPLKAPLDYKLICNIEDWAEDARESVGYFWFPCPPEGYESLGYVVTNSSSKPSTEEVRCIRSDLTDSCETNTLILTSSSRFPLHVWSSRPCRRGMWEMGLSTGTFFCSSHKSNKYISDIVCLKNINPILTAMPNIDQIRALIKEYGPTVFFHPKDKYSPSSVAWFFKKGALLYKKGQAVGQPIDYKGTNLPSGGSNDGEYWIDLPDDDTRNDVQHGDLDSAELYVHIKPALGGTFTDIAMWVFCPFNGPATIKLGLLNFPFKRVGEHVADWEHFTLRVCNFTGELWSIYFSQHSGGEWIDACNLEYIEGNKAIVYSSKNGHASFPHPGVHLQGSSDLGIGIRNDAAKSKIYVDSSVKYQIVAAEYLGDVVSEPGWLQYMREWGPKIMYNSWPELEKIIRFLPFNLRLSVERIFDKLPTEMYGEEGPTGPKEKNMWEGDERC